MYFRPFIGVPFHPTDQTNRWGPRLTSSSVSQTTSFGPFNLVGGFEFQPALKNMLVKLENLPPIFGVNMKNMEETTTKFLVWNLWIK